MSKLFTILFKILTILLFVLNLTSREAKMEILRFGRKRHDEDGVFQINPINMIILLAYKTQYAYLYNMGSF